MPFLDENGLSRLWTNIVARINGRMASTDPVGTGSFSMNRKAGTDVGEMSVALGRNCTASGKRSVAEGNVSTASGGSSHAEGYSTTASGNYSHAEGGKTLAAAQSAHAEGLGALALENESHAEGYYTVALGEYSHAEGYGKMADCYLTGSANTETYTTNALTCFDEEEIIGAVVRYGNNIARVVAVDCYTETITLDNTVSDVDLNNAISTIIAYGIASGNASHAEGYYTVASGDYSHAEGELTTASGENSHAEGESTTALGQSSHAEGGSLNKMPNTITSTSTNATIMTAWDTTKFSLAKGKYSHVEGADSLALGDASHAEGELTIASGEGSHAEGVYVLNEETGEPTAVTTASGMGAHAEGAGTTASGDASHAEGALTKALAAYSHAEGLSAIAYGTASHAEGYGAYAEGEAAHAEGYYTEAVGDYSHSGGLETYANGLYSHSFGYDAHADGDASRAHGISVYANSNCSIADGYGLTALNYQHVIGKFNEEHQGPVNLNTQDSGSGDAIFIVGCGTMSAAKNAFRITSGGKCFGSSAFGASGADFAELFEWADGNPNNEDRRGLFVALDGEKIRLANANDDVIGIISGAQAFVGNSASEEWHDKYLTDVFGEKITQEVEVPEVVDEKTGKVITPAHTATQYVLNPAYNPEEKYVMRESRKEWGIVGLVGQIVMIDDGTCVVGGRVAPSANGVGTASSEGYRVMKRIDENHIKVLVK